MISMWTVNTTYVYYYYFFNQNVITQSSDETTDLSQVMYAGLLQSFSQCKPRPFLTINLKLALRSHPINNHNQFHSDIWLGRLLSTSITSLHHNVKCWRRHCTSVVIKLGDINSYFTFKFYVPSNATNRSCFRASIL